MGLQAKDCPCMSEVREARTKGAFELSQPPILDKTVSYKEDDHEYGEVQLVLCKIANQVDD
jgi:hypothetical protein